MVRITLWADDGLGEDLGILLGAGPGSKVVRLGTGDVHVAVDECQQVIAVRASGISQVDDGDILVAVILPSDGSVVAGKI